MKAAFREGVVWPSATLQESEPPLRRVGRELIADALDCSDLVSTAVRIVWQVWDHVLERYELARYDEQAASVPDAASSRGLADVAVVPGETGAAR